MAKKSVSSGADVCILCGWFHLSLSACGNTCRRLGVWNTIEAASAIRDRPIVGKTICNMCRLIINAVAIVEGAVVLIYCKKCDQIPSSLLQHMTEL